MLKKISTIFAIIFFCTAIAVIPTIKSSTVANADGVAEIAIEQTGGSVFYEKNADKKLPMASTTKIMTALIIAEDCDLSEVITVPDSAVGVEGSSIYLKQDEQISVKDLLYGLMLRSGNDASVALAIHHSGDVDSFVKKMNERARELGANDTHFCNPNGLPCEGHYTTARNLAEIARFAMSNEVFSDVVSCKNYTGDFRSFTNKNKLLTRLDGANGVKTGYTEKAGRCLVSSAKRDGLGVICVVLNCYDMFERSQEIIETCFKEHCAEVISKDRIFINNGKAYTVGEDCTVILQRNTVAEYRITENRENSGDALLEIYCGNRLIFSHNLYIIN